MSETRLSVTELVDECGSEYQWLVGKDSIARLEAVEWLNFPDEELIIDGRRIYRVDAVKGAEPEYIMITTKELILNMAKIDELKIAKRIREYENK